MKFIIAFLVFISLVFCQPHSVVEKTSDEFYAKMKQSILDCIKKADNASPELQKYIKELPTDSKEPLILSKFATKNESDRLLIRRCRRESFLTISKER